MKLRAFLTLGLLCVAGVAQAQTNNINSNGSEPMPVTGNTSVFTWDALPENNIFLHAEEDLGFNQDYPVSSRVTNTSNKTVQFKFYRDQRAADSSELYTSICLGVCYANWIDSSMEAVPIEAGKSVEVIVHFEYGAASKDSMITYLKVAAVSEAPSDTLSIRFVTHAEPLLGVPAKGVSSNATEIVGLYPSSLYSGRDLNAVVNLAEPVANGTFTVYDVMGRAVQSRVSQLVKGENKVQISTATLPAGRYFLAMATSNGKMETKPFEVIR